MDPLSKGNLATMQPSGRDALGEEVQELRAHTWLKSGNSSAQLKAIQWVLVHTTSPVLGIQGPGFCQQ